MTKILLPLAACAALAGCVGYGDAGYGYGYGHPGVYGATSVYSAPGVYYSPNVYQGSAVYGSYPVYRNDVRRPRNRDRDGGMGDLIPLLGDGLQAALDPRRG